MIKHIVWWTLADEADGHSALENALRIKDMGEKLMGRIETLKSIEISAAIQKSTTVPVQVVLQSSHDTMEGLAAYANHPEHLKLVALIKKVSTSRQALDYEI